MVPLLSICIATMNRAAYLRSTLAGIAGQATRDVQVVVLDGGSSDATPEVVREFEAVLDLVYRRQPEPGGFDRDYDTAVSLASGEYCWLMSDDDALRPGAIDRVLRHLRDRSIGLVIVNASICNDDLSQVLKARFVDVGDDREYEPGDDERLFVEAGNYLTFIGCVVVRRAFWLQRERARYIGSLFIHVGVLFQAPLPARSLFVAEPLIAIRYGHGYWSARAFEIWMFTWPELIWSFRFSDRAKAAVCRQFPWMRPQALLLQRAKGSYTLSHYRRWLAPRRMSWRQRAAAITIAAMPVTVVNLLVSAALKLLVEDPGVALSDLENSRYMSLAALGLKALPRGRSSPTT